MPGADQALHKAAKAGLADTVAELLAADPALIDAKGMDARTPLHCAGTRAVAALLLDYGASTDARGETRFDTRTAAYRPAAGRSAAPGSAPHYQAPLPRRSM